MNNIIFHTHHNNIKNVELTRSNKTGQCQMDYKKVV